MPAPNFKQNIFFKYFLKIYVLYLHYCKNNKFAIQITSNYEVNQVIPNKHLICIQYFHYFQTFSKHLLPNCHICRNGPLVTAGRCHSSAYSCCSPKSLQTSGNADRSVGCPGSLGSSHQVCAFALGEAHYECPFTQIRGILRRNQLSNRHHAEDHVVGENCGLYRILATTTS